MKHTLQAMGYLARYGCTRPHGRVRIETVGFNIPAELSGGCTRPHGRVRIETRLSGYGTATHSRVAPAPTGG